MTLGYAHPFVRLTIASDEEVVPERILARGEWGRGKWALWERGDEIHGLRIDLDAADLRVFDDGLAVIALWPHAAILFRPQRPARELPLEPIHDIAATPFGPLLVSDADLLLVGPRDLWSPPRLAYDELRIVSVEGDEAIGTGWSGPENRLRPVRVDLRQRRVIEAAYP